MYFAKISIAEERVSRCTYMNVYQFNTKINFSFNNSFKKSYRNLSGQNVGKNSNLRLTSEQVTQNLLRKRKTLLMAPVQAAVLTPSQKITMESYMKTIQRQEPMN
jgi:hypothetical protein